MQDKYDVFDIKIIVYQYLYFFKTNTPAKLANTFTNKLEHSNIN
jgi:hypothetical protein